MFETYNAKSFGKYLKSIRVNQGMSQEKVSKITSLSTETLRKIENGYVLPRYDTLEYLSRAYKIDLLNVLKSFRYSNELFSFYHKIDTVIMNFDIDNINKLYADYNILLNDNCFNNLIENNDLNQLGLVVTGIQEFYNNSFTAALKCFNDALSISNTSFAIDQYKTLKYTLFEARILLMISMCKASLKEFKFANNLLIFLLDLLLKNNSSSLDKSPLVIKIYFNLSYNYHTINELEQVIKYSNDGIKYCNSLKSTYLLHGLFYRRGIAKFMLKHDDYLSDIQTSILLLKIADNNSLAEKYAMITQNKYGINTIY